MARALTLTITVLSIALLAQTGVAGEKKKTVKEILALVDATLTSVEDQTYTAEVSVIRNGKKIKNMKFEAVLKGLTMKRITFQSPGDVRGMTVLTTKDGLMYVYMPSYKRVRRVASHVRNQGFMGTDITAEELGTASLSTGWDGKIIKETDAVWVLKMTPQKGTETEFSKMEVTVSKKYGGVEGIKSFNSKGKVIRVQERSEWQSFGPVTIPTLMVYKDLQTGSRTELKFNGCKVNQGIPESTFTKRSLMRGN